MNTAYNEMNIHINDRVKTTDGKYHGVVSFLNRDADGIPCAVLSGGNLDGYIESDRIFAVSSLQITQFETNITKQNTIAPEKKWQSDISSGLGIGGIGSNDHNIGILGEHSAPYFSKRKSSGQLYEPCSKRGCDNEPSCLDCGYCLDKHCHCGE